MCSAHCCDIFLFNTGAEIWYRVVMWLYGIFIESRALQAKIHQIKLGYSWPPQYWYNLHHPIFGTPPTSQLIPSKIVFDFQCDCCFVVAVSAVYLYLFFVNVTVVSQCLYFGENMQNSKKKLQKNLNIDYFFKVCWTYDWLIQ